MTWWNDYIGIPYQERGRDRAGADCWGLARMVYKDQFSKDLPIFDGYVDSRDTLVDELIAQHREGWIATDQPSAGDLILFRIAGRVSHVGIFIGDEKFLHAREGHSACVERLNSGAWKHRVVGFYRYSEKRHELTLAGCPHPLRTQRVEVQFPAGSNIRTIVDWVSDQSADGLVSDLVVMIDGKIVPCELWDSTTTIPGQRIEYRAMPRGSGVTRALLTIAVVVTAIILAPYLAPFIGSTFGVSTAVATSLATAAITFAGTLLVNAIFPVRLPKPKDPGQSKKQNLLQGGNNQANPYGAIPVVLGKFRYTAPLAAVSYADTQSTAAYLKMILCWGYGPLQISDFRVGDVPIDTLEEIEYQSITGYTDTTEDKKDFDRIYGRDVSQQYFGTELVCIERDIASASRSSDVLTVTTTTAHTYISGQEVDVYLTGGGTISGAITVTSTIAFTMPSVGANGAVSATVVRYQPWTEHTITDESDSISVSLHFPEGLRQMATEGGNAGKPGARNFRAKIQVRQLDPITLSPITSWGDVDKIFAGGAVNLQPAWFNTDNDEELEPVYRWTRLSLDEYSNIVVRTGAFTKNPANNPTGTILLRQQEAAFGVNSTYNRLPDYGPSEEPLWDICMYGNTVYQTVDNRDATITGAALTVTGVVATVASATIPRAAQESVRYGGSSEKYYRKKDAFSTNIKFSVAKGVYQVRVRRTNDSTKDYVTVAGNKGVRFHTCQLLSVTGMSVNRPVVPPKNAALAMTAIRVRATNQLNGNIDGVSATVQSICKDWDRTTSTWIVRPTRNPASLLRYVLQHPANAQAVADIQIDLTALVDWHNYCRTNSFMFDTVVTEQQSLLDTLRDIAAAGRASPALQDGKWTVVIDRERTSIAQHFTPHNSWGFEGTRALPKMPHAFRVQFNNAERSYQPDEMIVYNDGYSSANATLFEGLELPGVTTRKAVFKHARFHLAQLKLRPETYTLNADIEHLICTRGDLVRVTHDVPMWGLGSGRIKNRISSTVLELDEQVPMDAGVQYTIRIRLEDGSSITRTVAAAATDGFYSTITLTSSVTATQAAPLNLFLFGALSAESVELIVQSIEPSENMTARLTLVDYSPAIYNSDSETVPPFDSQITQPPQLLQPTIKERPTITKITSDESVLLVVNPGQYAYQIKVAFTNPTTLPPTVTGVQGQIDFAEDTSFEWSSTEAFKAVDRAVMFGDVEEGTQYRIRLRYVDDAGRTGPWTATQLHTVVGKTSKPATASAMTFTITNSRLKIDWANNLEPDLKGYELRTADSGWGTSGYLYRGTSSEYLAIAKTPGVYNYYLKARDVVNLYSETARAGTFTVLAPSNPASVTQDVVKTTKTYVELALDWDDVIPTTSANSGQYPIGGYEIRTTNSGWGSGSGFKYKGNASAARLKSISATAPTTFYLRTYDINGNYATSSLSFTHDVTAPGTMAAASVTVTRLKSILQLSISGAPAKPKDFDEYEFQIGKVGTPGIPDGTTDNFWDDPDCLIVESTTDKAQIDLKLFPLPRFTTAGVKYRVAVRMRDKSGNYSPASALGLITVTKIT